MCDAFVANAAMAGDVFAWHIDGDPSCLPAGLPWRATLASCTAHQRDARHAREAAPPRTARFGNYCNREAGKPLFVSALLYLNAEWDADWAAETLFADSPSDTGVWVQPRRGRVVLMEQDVRHRINAPSPLAPAPRYSFVEKLVFVPRQGAARPTIARPAWGRPAPLGSYRI